MINKKIVFANWKMNLDADSISALVSDVSNKLKRVENVDIILAPPFPYIIKVTDMTKNTNIHVSSQNVFFEESGAFTGEVSPLMLTDVGCSWTMIGHSERRQHLLETNEMINKKVLLCTSNNLNVILCLATIDAKSGFSDKKPAPGCTASALVISAAASIGAVFK